MLPEFESIYQFYDSLSVARLNAIRLLEQSHFTHAVFKASMDEIFTQFYRDLLPCFVIQTE